MDAEALGFAWLAVHPAATAWAADAAGHAQEAGIDIEPVRRLLVTYLDPSAHRPDFDPLSPFPRELEQEAPDLEDLWVERRARAADALERLVVRRGGASSPELRLAALMAVVLAEDGRASTVELAEALAYDHEAYCDSHLAAWYWIALAYERDERPLDAVHAMARYLRLEP